MLLFRWSFALLLLGFALGCAGAHKVAEEAGLSSGPTITALSPDRGPAGDAYPIEVTIQGHGFAEEGNIVTFGGIQSEPLPSEAGGTRISFWVPKEVPSKGEVPPMILTPGEYDVTVTTPVGISEPATFLLSRGNG